MSRFTGKNAVIYARVSSNVQEDNYSFPTQLDTCRAYAKELGINVIAEFQEVASGGSLDRHELDKARRLIRAGEASIFIVYNTDRLSRNLGQMLFLETEIKQYNAELHYAIRSTTPENVREDAFENIESAFAEYERLRIKERLFTGRYKKLKGTSTRAGQVYGNGNPPYGYYYVGNKKSRTLIINESEASRVIDMFHWYADGVSSQHISDRLNEASILTPAYNRAAGATKREKPIWVPAIVYRILTSEVYVGKMHFNKTHRVGTRDIKVPREEWITVDIPSIVDEELFNIVQSRLRMSRKRTHQYTRNFYLLGKGRLKCQCGYTMTGSGNEKDQWYAYRCSGNSKSNIRKCNLKNIKAEDIEGLVWRWLCESLTPERIEIGIQVHRQYSATDIRTINECLEKIVGRLSELEKHSSKVISAYKEDIINIHELKREKGIIDAERQSLEREYARLENVRKDEQWNDAESLMADAMNLRARMPLMNSEEKLALLERLDLKATRRINEQGEQVIEVQSRIGEAILSLKKRD